MSEKITKQAEVLSSLCAGDKYGPLPEAVSAIADEYRAVLSKLKKALRRARKVLPSLNAPDLGEKAAFGTADHFTCEWWRSYAGAPEPEKRNREGDLAAAFKLSVAALEAMCAVFECVPDELPTRRRPLDAGDLSKLQEERRRRPGGPLLEKLEDLANNLFVPLGPIWLPPVPNEGSVAGEWNRIDLQARVDALRLILEACEAEKGKGRL